MSQAHKNGCFFSLSLDVYDQQKNLRFASFVLHLPGSFSTKIGKDNEKP